MKTIRIILLVLTGFAALTCIGGGIALTTGMEKERIPISWLQGTPFNDYTLPGIFLAATGVINLLAFFFILKKSVKVKLFSVLAGLTLAAFIIVEIILLKQDPPAPTSAEIFYLAIAALICLLSWRFKSNKIIAL